MSLPLSGCMIIKAIRGDEKMTNEIAKRLVQPAFTYHPCKCKPKCELPDEKTTLAFFEHMDTAHPEASKKLVALITQ